MGCSSAGSGQNNRGQPHQLSEVICQVLGRTTCSCIGRSFTQNLSVYVADMVRKFGQPVFVVASSFGFHNKYSAKHCIFGGAAVDIPRARYHRALLRMLYRAAERFHLSPTEVFIAAWDSWDKNRSATGWACERIRFRLLRTGANIGNTTVAAMSDRSLLAG